MLYFDLFLLLLIGIVEVFLISIISCQCCCTTGHLSIDPAMKLFERNIATGDMSISLQKPALAKDPYRIVIKVYIDESGPASVIKPNNTTERTPLLSGSTSDGIDLSSGLPTYYLS